MLVKKTATYGGPFNHKKILMSMRQQFIIKSQANSENTTESNGKVSSINL